MVVAKLNDRARRAKNRGETENLSIDEISVRYGLPKVRFVDEFDEWISVLIKALGEAVFTELFYELK
ncbi:hypothetical protein [Vibrio parahaemolyticus]|uniref:hypothetical protein n=1 Tax=Vibrio parahaemolyticus TaxID=670 RepID=UPI001E329697|nr:hypothetical protein [Vibrio parahaemolyticus]